MDSISHMGHLVKKLNHALINQISETLKPYALGHSQWQVLHYVIAEEKISIKKLREQLQVESGTLTGVIDALIRKGWVIREEDKKDRRIKQITMTEEGRKRWEAMPDPKSFVNEKLIQNIKPDDLNIAKKVLAQAYRNLTQ